MIEYGVTHLILVSNNIHINYRRFNLLVIIFLFVNDRIRYEYINPNLGKIFFTYIAIAAGTVWATEQERLPEQGRKCLVSKVCGSCVGRTLTVT